MHQLLNFNFKEEIPANCRVIMVNIIRPKKGFVCVCTAKWLALYTLV